MIMTGRTVSRRLQNRKGAVLAFVAIVMVALMGMMAFTLSVGAGDRQRRIAQTAADAGAVGGGTQIYRGMDSTTVVTAALNAAMMNGFVASEITVNFPPKTGPHAADNKYVEVFINKMIATIFGSASILQRDSVAVQARGVAGLGGPSNFCLLALGTSGNAIDIPGDVTASNCGVASNASISVRKLVASVVEAVGTIDPASPTNISGIAPIPNPFQNLQMPSGADTVCTHSGMLTITKDTALTKGVYCGGITIDKNITVTFGPGTYFIRGGGLTGGEVSAKSGVTIINGNGPNNNVAAFRPIVFGNSCLFDITAPTSGPYQGFAVIVDPNAPSSGANSINQVCGVGDIVGTVYIPTQTFELANSNGKLTITGSLIAAYVTGQNGGGQYTFTLNSGGSNPLKRLSLVE